MKNIEQASFNSDERAPESTEALRNERVKRLYELEEEVRDYFAEKKENDEDKIEAANTFGNFMEDLTMERYDFFSRPGSKEEDFVKTIPSEDGLKKIANMLLKKEEEIYKEESENTQGRNLSEKQQITETEKNFQDTQILVPALHAIEMKKSQEPSDSLLKNRAMQHVTKKYLKEIAEKLEQI